MMARVAVGTWPGGLKLFREALLKTDDHHLEVTLIIPGKCMKQNGHKISYCLLFFAHVSPANK